jgi:thiamine transport system substrate-binding protein
MNRATLAGLMLVGALLAGCGAPPAGPNDPYTSLPGYVKDPTGRNATAWPDLEGETITILDNGAFQWTFDAVANQFKALTGVEAKLEDGTETAASLQKLIAERKAASYDVIWGVDNIVYVRAADVGILKEYKPQLADRIDPDLLFVPAGQPWLATPVDHGYVGLNIDLAYRFNTTIDALSDVDDYADQLVVENPNTSGPGLAFLLATIGEFGENPPYTNAPYDWREYWKDLLRGPDRNRDGQSDGCVLVVPRWTDAYVQHFSAGYGLSQGGLGDKPIVVSYTQSPAYEVKNGMAPDAAAIPLTAGRSTYHQIQTVAIVNGTKNLQAAQAWVEFTLTDFFQEQLPGSDVMYPAVRGIDHNGTFGALDPEPGSFTPVEFPLEDLARRGTDSKGKPGQMALDRWVKEWQALYEDPDLNCSL